MSDRRRSVAHLSSTLGRLAVVLAPALWLSAFFIAPFLIVLKISLSQTAIAQPPYVPLFEISNGWEGLRDFVSGLSFESYRLVLSDNLYVLSALRSVEVAAGATALLLLTGVPIAYALSRVPPRWQPTLVVLVVLPFWTSFLIRIYAWMALLQPDGFINRALNAVGVIDRPIAFLATDRALYIGLVYSYLPFMVLPAYASFQKIDSGLLEAAADLGSPPWRTFWSVTLRLAAPGLLAGALLCFIPIVGEFVTPDLLAGSDSMMLGQTLWTEFFANKDWPVAAAVATLLLALLLPALGLTQRAQARASKS